VIMTVNPGCSAFFAGAFLALGALGAAASDMVMVVCLCTGAVVLGQVNQT
jgi:hypothetical protein